MQLQEAMSIFYIQSVCVLHIPTPLYMQFKHGIQPFCRIQSYSCLKSCRNLMTLKCLYPKPNWFWMKMLICIPEQQSNMSSQHRTGSVPSVTRCLKAPHSAIFWHPNPCKNSPPACLHKSGRAFITNSWLTMHTSLIYTAGLVWL